MLLHYHQAPEKINRNLSPHVSLNIQVGPNADKRHTPGRQYEKPLT